MVERVIEQKFIQRIRFLDLLHVKIVGFLRRKRTIEKTCCLWFMLTREDKEVCVEVLEKRHVCLWYDWKGPHMCRIYVADWNSWDQALWGLCFIWHLFSSVFYSGGFGKFCLSIWSKSIKHKRGKKMKCLDVAQL